MLFLLVLRLVRRRFQCSSASRKFLNHSAVRSGLRRRRFQCSSASRKFLNQNVHLGNINSVIAFSALQRAENSSIVRCPTRPVDDKRVSVLFSEPKIPQFLDADADRQAAGSFSALQRAENSSIRSALPPLLVVRRFQCSSASRKFLNLSVASTISSGNGSGGFSALQRAENSSIASIRSSRTPHRQRVSVLFSEPKIPQFDRTA